MAERICAWCRKSMGTVEGDFKPAYPVTHGICAACGCVLLRAGSEFTPREFMDRPDVPLPLVDAKRRVE